MRYLDKKQTVDRLKETIIARDYERVRSTHVYSGSLHMEGMSRPDPATKQYVKPFNGRPLKVRPTRAEARADRLNQLFK